MVFMWTLHSKKTDKNVTIGVVDPEVIKILKCKFPYSISAQMFNRKNKTSLSNCWNK